MRNPGNSMYIFKSTRMFVLFSVSVFFCSSRAIAQLPSTLGWYEIKNTSLAPVCMPLGMLGDAYCEGLTGAWNSGIADTKRNRLVLWGGGHADYSGNEVYALDLNTQKMLRLDMPSVSTSACVETDTDGTPTSRHTYGGVSYVPTMDKMFMHGGALWPCGHQTVATWFLDFPKLISNGTSATGVGAWARQDPVSGTPVTEDCCNYQNFGDYDPNTDKIFFSDDYYFWRYDPHTNTMTRLNGLNGMPYHPSAVIDYDHKLYIRFGDGAIYHADLSVSTPTLHEVDYSTCNCASQMKWGYPGLAYDPTQKLVVIWNGGPNVYTYNPLTLTCSTHTYSSGPPGLGGQAGVFGHFRYFPALGVFAEYTDTLQNAWVLRMTNGSSSDTTPPVISAETADSITGIGAVISWTTNEPSTGQVEYGKTAAYESQTSIDGSLVTNHAISLSGLSGNTLYHYRVKSVDASANLATGSDHTFSTVNVDTVAPAISAMAAGNIGPSGAVITWLTDKPATSQVEYGLGASYGQQSTVDSGLLTIHSITITGLSSGVTYHYRALSRNSSGVEGVSLDKTFLTNSLSVNAGVHPNPFSLSEGSVVFAPGAQQLKEVKIFTVSGIIVKTLKAGAGNITWDGRNDNGQKVARGVYLYKITYTTGDSAIGKLAIVR